MFDPSLQAFGLLAIEQEIEILPIRLNTQRDACPYFWIAWGSHGAKLCVFRKSYDFRIPIHPKKPAGARHGVLKFSYQFMVTHIVYLRVFKAEYVKPL